MKKRKNEDTSFQKDATISETMKKVHDLDEKLEYEYKVNELDSLYSIRNRARSVTVGTAFGGVVEINLRSENNYLYAQMQPTECIELIEQLAAGCGVEIAMRPKQNFASWRGWEEVIDQRIGFDKIAWKGTAAWQLGGDKLEENYKELHGIEESKQIESEESKKKRKNKK